MGRQRDTENSTTHHLAVSFVVLIKQENPHPRPHPSGNTALSGFYCRSAGLVVNAALMTKTRPETVI